MMFLFFLCVPLIFEKVVSQSDASSACANVLQQGVYNVFSASTSTISYSQFQASMCAFQDSMTYDKYLSAGDDSASRSTYNAWNADASFFGISPGGGSSSGSSQMTESEFNQFKSFQASYSSQYCVSSSGSSSNPQLFNQYMQTINPQVFSAYASCVSLYGKGIQFESQYGFRSSSAFINVEFTPTTFGEKATITGATIHPEGAATCQLFGDKGLSSKFYVAMVPDETYSIVCKSYNNASVDVVDIAISTTQGIYMTYLYNRPPTPFLSQLQAQVTQLQTKMNQLESLLTTTNEVVGVLGSSYTTGMASAALDWERSLNTRMAYASLNPFPLTVTITESGTYLVVFTGRLRGFSATDTGYKALLYHNRCSCVYSDAFGGPTTSSYPWGNTPTTNSWIGNLVAGDVLELKYFLWGSAADTSIVYSGDGEGMQTVNAILLRPGSDSTCKYCINYSN
jgi:hypothetical protein